MTNSPKQNPKIFHSNNVKLRRAADDHNGEARKLNVWHFPLKYYLKQLMAYHNDGQ